MVLNVSDNASHRRDQIANLAELLTNAPTRQALVRAVYFGKKRVKSVGELAAILSSHLGAITPKRVTEIGKPLVNRAFVQERIVENGRKTTAYAKFDNRQLDVKEALKLANNKPRRDEYHTKSNPKIRIGGHTVSINVPFVPRVESLSVDDVKEFAKVKLVKNVPEELTPLRLPETVLKRGVVKLLGEELDPKDWGGELNDVFTTRATVKGKRRRAAFALKGPAKKGPLVPKMMGKNGDQVQRLFSSPAQVFFVQYEGEIKESIVDLMTRLATAKAVTEREVFFGVIDQTDTYRLRVAYPKVFEP
jgi:hypothetical protein